MDAHKRDYKVLLFEGSQEWAAWLEQHHAASSGVWLRLARKASVLRSVSYVQALDVALCYGWIDGQKKSYTVPGDFQAKLDHNARAKAFFATLNSTNRYAILYRIQTAKKPETRAKRIQQFIHMLENHEKLHP
jgi:uncharacterized protein YdeI (YjbR/CyaY-like superfamily)